ncbi:MAG TPA: hypothetical protein VLA21_00790, partial [Candidatus Limnocylindria bacterium]|nr:hypothetical protein [Candidatus Limnocylindria bacterium]
GAYIKASDDAEAADAGGEPFSASRAADAFNNSFITAFAGVTAKVGELKTSKYKVITACAYATNSWENYNGGHFTRGIVNGAVLSAGRMPADANRNSVVTQQEAYVSARNYCDTINNASYTIPSWDLKVQVYPANSTFSFFQR